VRVEKCRTSLCIIAHSHFKHEREREFVYNTCMHRSAVIQLNSHTNNERCRWSMTIALCYAISTHNVLTIITECLGVLLIQTRDWSIRGKNTHASYSKHLSPGSTLIVYFDSLGHLNCVFVFHEFPLCSCCFMSTVT
jgi:hypothetical protein